MIAAWMLYCVAIGLALAVVGVALERGLHLAGRPTRWAWVVALAGSFVIPAAAWLRPEAFTSVAVPVPPIAVAEPATVVAPLPGAAALPAASAPTFSLGDLDGALRWGWGVSSVVLLCILGTAALRLAVLRKRWRVSRVDGRPVLVSDNVGPAVAGLWRPEVVVPGWALALGQPQRRLMLSHEEEHVRAADPWLLVCGAAALVLMPWNPALWWQVRRLRLAVEMDCDARVLARGGTPPEYGELLLQVGRRRSVLALGAPALSEPSSFLERRIRRMATTLPRWRWAGATVALAVATAAVIGACETPRPVAPDPEGVTALLARLDSVSPALLARLDSASPALLARLDSVMAMAWRMQPAKFAGTDPTHGDASSRLAAVAVRQYFPELLQGREEPVYVWIVLDDAGRPVSKGTTPRALGNKVISTEMGARLLPGYDSLIARHAREYGALGYGTLAPNSPPVLWVRLGRNPDGTSSTPTPLQRPQATDRYFDPAPDYLRSLAHQYHPESFVNPRPGTAIALVFDARDQVIGHAAGVRTAADDGCTDVVHRLVPQFRYARFLSAGCADAAGPHGAAVVYWGSLRRR
jgi:BlaR1 peptidase M56